MVKLPFKMKIISIDFHKTQYDGGIEFHEMKFQIDIICLIRLKSFSNNYDHAKRLECLS